VALLRACLHAGDCMLACWCCTTEEEHQLNHVHMSEETASACKQALDCLHALFDVYVTLQVNSSAAYCQRLLRFAPEGRHTGW
jgi:hypothetical protein